MNIISRKRLLAQSSKYPDCEEQVNTWYHLVKGNTWKNIKELNEAFPKSSILNDNRMVFRIKGNAYRLIAKFNFKSQQCFFRWFGLHKDYDRIDANNI